MLPERRLSLGFLSILALILILISIAWLRSSRPVPDGQGAAPTTAPFDEHAPRVVDLASGPRIAQEPVPAGMAGADERVLLVRVTDNRGTPIEGAVLYSRRQGVSRILGVTPPEGELEVARPISCTEFLAARAGYASSAQSVGCTPTAATSERRDVLLRLDPVARLRGETWVGVDPGPQGVTVVALPEELGPRMVQLDWSAFLADPEVVLGTTDEFGQFELQVHPDLGYLLMAGGQGLLQVRCTEAARAGDPGIRLELKAGYILSVRFVDGDGAPLELPSALPKGGGGIDVRPMSKALEWAPVPDLAGFLAGMPLESRWSGIGEPGRLSFLYVSDSQDQRLGPISVQARFPGYRPVNQTVWARALGRGWREDLIALHQVTDGFSSIQLSLTGPTLEPGPESTRYLPWRFLDLTGPDGATSTHRLQDWVGTRCTVGGVPVGEYDWRFWTCPGESVSGSGGDLTSGTVRVTPGSVAAITVHLASRASLTLQVRSRDGRAYVGPLSGALSELPRVEKAHGTDQDVQVLSGVESFQFVSAPYTLNCVPSGSHAVRLTFPSATPVREVSLEAGEPQVLDFELRP